MVKALLAKNADVNIKDNTGTTPFSYGKDKNFKIFIFSLKIDIVTGYFEVPIDRKIWNRAY